MSQQTTATDPRVEAAARFIWENDGPHDVWEMATGRERGDYIALAQGALRAAHLVQRRDEEHVGYWDSAGFLPLAALPVHVEDQRRFLTRARPLFAITLSSGFGGGEQ